MTRPVGRPRQHPVTSPIAQWVTAARRARQLSQMELAIACNVTSRTVGAWESGDASPRADEIMAIVEATGVAFRIEPS